VRGPAGGRAVPAAAGAGTRAARRGRLPRGVGGRAGRGAGCRGAGAGADPPISGVDLQGRAAARGVTRGLLLEAGGLAGSLVVYGRQVQGALSGWTSSTATDRMVRSAPLRTGAAGVLVAAAKAARRMPPKLAGELRCQTFRKYCALNAALEASAETACRRRTWPRGGGRANLDDYADDIARVSLAATPFIETYLTGVMAQTRPARGPGRRVRHRRVRPGRGQRRPCHAAENWRPTWPRRASRASTPSPSSRATLFWPWAPSWASPERPVLCSSPFTNRTRLDQVTVMVPHRAGRGAAEHHRLRTAAGRSGCRAGGIPSCRRSPWPRRC
jgi:hypothetical protein